MCFICIRVLLPAQKTAIKNNTIYFLSSIFVESKKNSLAKDQGHIVFNTKINTAACFTSCNFIQLNYSIKKQELIFKTINPGTDVCPDPLINLEEDFKSLLSQVSSYKCIGKDLIFFRNTDTLMMFYEREFSKN